ncbi:MAG: hypothetical protein U0263_41015 [Polyangiaceae bacterium]
MLNRSTSLRIGLTLALLAFGCSSSSTNENPAGGGGAGGGGGVSGAGTGGASGGAAGTLGTPATLYCGGLNCNAKTDKCCYGATDIGLSGTDCAASGNKCPTLLTRSLDCDDAADCQAKGSPNAFCCASPQVGPCAAGADSEHCIAGAQCALPENCGGTSFFLCDPAAESSCPIGFKCNPENGTIHRGVCKPG